MNCLFDTSDKYVIIYASNKNKKHYNHVRHQNLPIGWSKWKLIQIIPNKSPPGKTK